LAFSFKRDNWIRGGAQMLDPVLAVAAAAFALTVFSLVLARVIPDRYDNLELSRVPTRRR
jgi:hypothetical protein